MFCARLILTVFTMCFSHAVFSAVAISTLIPGVSSPTAYIDPPDGIAHRFVARQAGLVVVWNGTSVLSTPFLDLSNVAPVAQRKVLFGGERGLLSMTMHPNYASNGFFYLYYTSTNWDGAGGINAGDIVVERYTRDPANVNLAQFSSGQIILVVPHPDSNHNGGDIKFGPDGYLYVSLGDGGGGCDSTAGSGQDTNQLLGKMLRLDVDGTDAFPADPLLNYAIPATNPLVGVTGRDEIWALGLRNPFRFSFDRVSGDILIGDVGQDDWEELNLISPTAVTSGNPINFGWPCREGPDPAGCGTPPQGCAATFVDPVRSEANGGAGGTWTSIMGGYRYRGTRTPDLIGKYLYGDAGNGEVWSATTGATPWPATLVTTGQTPFGFAEDNFGELYVLNAANGRIGCVHDGGGCTTWSLREDTLFSNGFE